MGSKLQERIGSLEERLKQYKAQEQKSAARKRAADGKKKRRDDTRRKILVGAIVMAKVDQGVLEKATLLSWLDAALIRDEDRELFEFGTAAPSPNSTE